MAGDFKSPFLVKTAVCKPPLLVWTLLAGTIRAFVLAIGRPPVIMVMTVLGD